MHRHCGAIVYIYSISLAENSHVYIVAHHSNRYNDGTLNQYMKNCFHIVYT